MLTITDKINCCGCQACAHSCPQKCIRMKADEEGFLYPQIDSKMCVNCGLCEKVCPILHPPKTYPVLESYAAKHTHTEVKLKSSSGGMFTALAEIILKEGGVVFGAGFDKTWNVVHRSVENLPDLDNLRRSKYVQSDIGKTYQQAKQFLDKGRKVLFTGTPCQIAGLRNYLGKEDANLLTAEIFCHGTPSPGVWKKFLKENFDLSKIKAINFREKRLGWRKFYLNFTLPNGLHAHSQKRSLAETLHLKSNCSKGVEWFYYNSFFLCFVRELINRPACHSCSFRGCKLADFSMGDLWGQWPDIITPTDKQTGLSAVTLNTPKAQQVFKQLSIISLPVDYHRIANPLNFPLFTSPKPHPKRALFFARYRQENINKLTRELLNLKPLYIALLSEFFIRIYRKLRPKHR